jgi:RNA polymerase sigma factor FliA
MNREHAPAISDHDRLVLDSVVLVHAVVREVAARVPSSVDRADLTSAGLEALVGAARAFDPERGVPFTAYARTRIRGALVDELRSYDWASRGVRRTARDIEKVRDRMAVALGQTPSAVVVARELGVEVGVVHRSEQDLARAAIGSLDEQYGGTTVHLATRTRGPEESLERVEQVELISDAIQELPPRLRTVVRGFFLEERPMAEIAVELGVSESRVSQLRAEALVLLRTVLNRLHEEGFHVPEIRSGGAADRRRSDYVSLVARRHRARRSGDRDREAISAASRSAVDRIA